MLQEGKGQSSKTCRCHHKWTHQTSQKAVLSPCQRLSGSGRGGCVTLELENKIHPSAVHALTEASC